MQHLLHDCTLNPVSYERLCIVFDVCHLLYDQRFLKNDKFTSRCIFGDQSSLKRLGERSLLQIIHWLRQYAGTVKLWILTCINTNLDLSVEQMFDGSIFFKYAKHFGVKKWTCFAIWVSAIACRLKGARDSGYSSFLIDFLFLLVEYTEDQVRGRWVVLLYLLKTLIKY